MREGYRTVATLAELFDAPERALELQPPEAAAMLAKVGALEAVLRARITTTVPAHNGERPEPPGSRDLTVTEAAERLRKSVRWVTDNWRKKGMPGRKRGRTTVFPELELERWQKRY